jgi:hypothetical protein
MPRRKYYFLPGREDETVDCFAYHRTKAGKPACRALTDIYCLKTNEPCVFRATPEDAAEAQRLAAIQYLRRKRV